MAVSIFKKEAQADQSYTPGGNAQTHSHTLPLTTKTEYARNL